MKFSIYLNRRVFVMDSKKFVKADNRNMYTCVVTGCKAEEDKQIIKGMALESKEHIHKTISKDTQETAFSRSTTSPRHQKKDR